jgi:MSHA biogenesis protein MshM
LLKLHQSGKHVVVCLDEVQAMPVKTLESLRLLTNLETEKRKLIQVVLFGQPELESLLNQPSIRQLKQRITFSYRLLPLNRVAMNKYIHHRLATAGYPGKQLFSQKALEKIYKHSGGLPRLINIIAHKSLLSAFGEGSHKVTPGHVRDAVSDMEEVYTDTPAPYTGLSGLFNRWLYGAVGLIIVIIGTLSYYGKPDFFP